MDNQVGATLVVNVIFLSFSFKILLLSCSLTTQDKTIGPLTTGTVYTVPQRTNRIEKEHQKKIGGKTQVGSLPDRTMVNGTNGRQDPADCWRFRSVSWVNAEVACTDRPSCKDQPRPCSIAPTSGRRRPKPNRRRCRRPFCIETDKKQRHQSGTKENSSCR